VIENLGIRVRPFVTTAKTKQQAITALQLAVEQRRLKHVVPELLAEQHIYEWDDARLQQDCVMAAAMACLAAARDLLDRLGVRVDHSEPAVAGRP
jgi:hypothetical protein